MVLIPPDAAIRMRMQTEAELLQPLQPVRGIPADLPALQRGQTFTAQIREALPDNTYRALVAGKQLTLQLPEGAKAGDELELVVLDRSGKVVIARQVDAGNTQAGSGSNAPYPFAKFSPAARMIGQLLPNDGEAAPPAQLNRGQPLLAQPPQAQNAAATLAPALGKAVAQSGLFYEAHQAQWVSGKLPLTTLLQEPQGQRSAPVAYQHAAAEKVSAGGTALTLPAASAVAPRELAANTAMLPQATNPAQTTTLAQTVPDDLRPLVQQQLEAVATNRMVWHGEIWPRQSMDWEIEWNGEREADGSSEEEARWRTALSLTTPRLGRVDAHLQLSAKGVSITLVTPLGTSAADLRDAAPALTEALAAAGVPLLGFKVSFENEYPAGQG
ncbi:MAG: flagellar hook-length control protein FliK [Pseudomonadota bacterium]